MEATDFAARLAGADLVITGEGRIDAQTGFGKTALGVARRAAEAGVACIAVGGGVELDGIDALAAVGAIAVPVVEHPQSVEAAMAAGRRRRSSDAASGSPASSRCGCRRPPRSPRSSDGHADSPPTAQAPLLGPRPDVGQGPRATTTWARGVRPRRAGRAVRPADLAAPARPDERADPDDPDPEQRGHRRRGRVRGAAHALPGLGRARAPQPGRRLGRRRAARRCRARLGGDRVRATPRAGRDDLAGRPRQPEGAAHPGHAAGDPRGTRRLLARVPRRHVRARGTRLADADRRDRQEDRVGAAAVLVRPAAHAGRSARRAGRSSGSG